ncbi:TPA: hypothetical protein ACH3X2_007658 [Trebouxia sp. C0005]
MSRQDAASDAASSVGGASDAGSEAGKSDAGSHGGDQAADILKESKFSLKAAIFGVVYSLKKLQLDRDFRLGIPTLFLEFLQWLILIFGPEWDWDVNWSNSFWRFYSRWQLQRAIAERSHIVFLVVFYLMVAVIFFILCVCLYIYSLTRSRKQPRWQWPLTAFRILVFLVFTTFQTSFLLLFTVTWTCPIIGKRVNKQLSYFPGVYCLKGANLIHAAVGIAMSLLFALISLVLAIADGSDLNPHSKAYYASPCGKWTFRRAFIKSALPIVAAALPNYIHLRAWLYLALLLYNYWIQMRHVPYYHTWINCVFAFSSCTYAWGALLLVIATYVRAHWDIFTIVFYCGVVPNLISVFLIGSRLKTVRYFAQKMSHWTADLTPSEQHHFRDQYEAELCARVSRKTTLDEAFLIRVPHPQAISLADTIIKAGIHQYPESVFLLIVQTGLRIYLKNDKPGAALAKAKLMAPSMTEQYQIFKLDQMELERMALEDNDNMDMASYAEFQRQFKGLKEAHRQVLLAIRAFWQVLTQHNIKYLTLVSHFKKVEQSQTLAERGYRQGLLMYPRSPALLRSYAQFMQDIKLNPHASMRYYVEADKLEAQQTESRKETMLTKIDGSAMDAETVQMLSIIDEEKDANIIINSEGIIQFANKGVTTVFGWNKADVEGKNISMLMPPPYSQMHNGILRAYNESGTSNIINRTRELQGLHMDRYSFPIKLAVTKVAQTGSEGFMGVIKPIADDANIAMVYVTPAGIIVSVGRGFNNLFGHETAEHIGRPLRSICKDPEEFNKLLSGAVASTTSSGLTRAASGVEGQDVGNLTIAHKFGDEITVRVKIMKAGVGAAKTIMMTMIPMDYHTCFIAISPHAKILYANESMASLLGRKVTEISGKMSLPQLMTIPCQQLHQNFFKGRDTSKVAGLSCRSGRVVLAGDRNYNPVPITMILREHEDDIRGKVWTARIAAATPEQQVAWHTMHVIIDSFGIISKARSDPALFGVKTEELMGQSVAFCIDLFRAMIETGGNMAENIKNFLAEAKTSRQQVWRVGICPKGRRTVPGLMKVQFLEDDKFGLLIFHAENLDGVLELDTGCVIKAARETAALMFGVPVSEMLGKNLSDFLPHACPSRNAEDMLIVGDATANAGTKRGGLGGNKKVVGKLMPLEAKHADGSTLAMIGQAAKHPEKARVLVRLRLFKPVSPKERTAAMAASMSREAKLLPTVLPIEATPTGVPSTPGRPLIDFSKELPPPAALAVPAGGHGGPGSIQPQSIKLALEASDMMLANKERDANKALTPRMSRSTKEELAAFTDPNNSKARLGATVSRPGPDNLPALAQESATLAEVIPSSAKAFEQVAPPVQPIAAGTPYEVPIAKSGSLGGSELDAELESHHGSQTGSGAVSEHEGDEIDEDEAAAAADFTPMTEEKRVFVNEWIAKLGNETFDDENQVEDTGLDQEANDAAARVAGVGGDREDRGLLAAAAEDDEAEGGAVNNLDSASAAGDSPEAGDITGGADFARAKRFKKLTARLSSAQAKSKMARLRSQTMYVLLFLMVIHIGAFAATRVLIAEQKTNIEAVTSAGNSVRSVINLATQAREMQVSGYSYSGNGSTSPITIRSQAAIAVTMNALIAEISQAQNTLYLGIGKTTGSPKAELEALFNTANLNTTIYQDTNPVTYTYVEQGLWDAGNTFIASARAVTDLPDTYRYNFSLMPQWNYLLDNVYPVGSGLVDAMDLQVRCHAQLECRLYTCSHSLCDIVLALINILSPKNLPHANLCSLLDGLINRQLACLPIKLGMLVSPKLLTLGWLLQTAAAQDSAKTVLLADIILLVVEGGVLIPVAFVYMYWVIRTITIERVNLYSIFLRVPRPTVVAISKAEIRLVGEDGFDDDDEPAANAEQKEDEEGKWATTKGMQYSARGRKLDYSRSAILWMVLPLIAWMALIILTYGLSYMLLSEALPRLSDVNGNSRVQAYTYGAKFYATEMAFANDSVTLANSRVGLNGTATELRTWHETVLYSSSTSPPTSSELHYRPSTLQPAYRASPAVETVYYSDGCLRLPASTCLNSSNIWYPPTNHGLNLLTYYYLDRTTLMVDDDDEDIGTTNTRFQFIWGVTDSDMSAAQSRIQDLFQSFVFQPLSQEQVLQIVVFVVMFAGALGFFIWNIKPFLAQFSQERKRTAQLLSQLPADIDIAMLLQPESATIAASIKKGKKGIAPAGSSVMLSSLRG